MSDRRKPDFASEQRRAQRLVELFNNNERLWNSLAGKRRLRMFELMTGACVTVDGGVMRGI